VPAWTGDHAQGVGDDVVELPGDPCPLVGCSPPRPLQREDPLHLGLDRRAADPVARPPRHTEGEQVRGDRPEVHAVGGDDDGHHHRRHAHGCLRRPRVAPRADGVDGDEDGRTEDHDRRPDRHADHRGAGHGREDLDRALPAEEERRDVRHHEQP
jgi:hypothetical protein